MVGNIFDKIPGVFKDELTEILLQNGDFRVERIVSRGHVSPPDFWYDQEQQEWILLLAGEAVLEFMNQEEVRLKKGDYLLIPAHQKHRVKWTDPEQDTIWLAIYG